MVLIIGLMTLFLIQVLFALLKYSKTTTFHTYAANLAAVLQGAS